MAEINEKKKNSMTLKLGNLLPGQEAVLNLTIVEEAEIVGGAYCYSMPGSLFPDYSKHKTRNEAAVAELKNTYSFNYEFKIFSSDKITYLSAPKAS